MRYFLTFTLTLISTFTFGQFGVQLNTDKATESYTLFENFSETYLVDNCGFVVNRWSDVAFTDLHSKLLDNGNLNFMQDNTVYEVDWEGNIVKELNHNVPSLMLKYEVIKLKNGNYLCVARHEESFSFFSNLGYDFTNQFPSYDDTVVELDGETGEVVWEWRISDHAIQDRIQNLDSYGVIEDNPGKLDIYRVSDFDWEFDEYFMINGMDYNPELDQIALSVRKMGEVIIIDHSTTTAEAKTSKGGRYGQGGDILYRWGNPENYGRGTEADRRLYYQHNPNWIQYGPHKGKLMIFNNNLNRPGQTFDNLYSQFEIISPDVDGEGFYNLPSASPFRPMDADTTFSGEDLEFYSGYTSGAKVLPNGNIFVTTGRDDTMREFTPQGELVWQYNIPRSRYIFRAEKYSVDHPAFEGKDLTPGFTVESSNDYDCVLGGVSSTEETALEFNTTIQIKGVLLFIDSETEASPTIYNLAGQALISKAGINKSHILDISQLPSGLYVLRLLNRNHSISKSIFIP